MSGVVILANLFTPLPYGDLAEYSVYAAKSFKDYEAHVPRLVATLTVFPAVTSARRASVAIRRGGECLPHPTKRYFSPWNKCDHLRVENVLLIVSSAAVPRVRATLLGAMRRLGAPTVS
jgi:hypothetical protein